MYRIVPWFFIFNMLATSANAQLVYDTPESVGLSTVYIESNVDSIMLDAIHQKAFPGAQLLVAKHGKVIFHKAYGFHTYDSIQNVTKNDIYDLASVTKITGPLPALMTTSPLLESAIQVSRIGGLSRSLRLASRSSSAACSVW